MTGRTSVPTNCHANMSSDSDHVLVRPCICSQHTSSLAVKEAHSCSSLQPIPAHVATVALHGAIAGWNAVPRQRAPELALNAGLHVTRLHLLVFRNPHT